MREVGGDVQSRHDDQRLNYGKDGPRRLRRLRLAAPAQIRRSDDVIDDALRQHVPHSRHGHRVTRRRPRSRLARRRILEDIGQIHGRILHLHLVDPPVRTITVHQPVFHTISIKNYLQLFSKN